ncbi:pyruvate decarboxylase 2-like [Iris pallida]|uniref:Pyruvate decarboxylase 2-like n=1 Tax=Iris pallida TaxID=29817 RepID=A0AAX6F491_IRIPA|nr:pyruvate decarboxylase 2-like [Iris pallida]KAJ6810805.1 pyruvate decarboxylase 2-like [Iris pallida]
MRPRRRRSNFSMSSHRLGQSLFGRDLNPSESFLLLSAVRGRDENAGPLKPSVRVLRILQVR